MLRRRWTWLLLGAATPVLFFGFDRLFCIRWLGSDDLDIEFVVTDADSGEAISGACVEVQSEGGYEEDYPQVFSLGSGQDGTASKLCRQCTSVGQESGLKITDTHVVYPPHWGFRASAGGYEQSQWSSLETTENVPRVQWDGTGPAKLVVPIALKRKKR